MKEGKCFKCGQSGHRTQICPNAPKGLEQGKLACLALSGPWLGSRKEDACPFVLRDVDILQIEKVLGSSFSQIFAYAINPQSAKLAQTKLLSTLNYEALEGHASLVILPKSHISIGIPIIRDATLHHPNNQVVVLVEGQLDAMTSSPLNKGWTRLQTWEPGHTILPCVNGTWAREKTRNLLCAYLRVPTKPNPALAFQPLGLTMEFKGLVSNAKANILLDSEAGASFLHARFARIHGIRVTPAHGTITCW